MQAETVTNGLRYLKLIVVQMNFKSHVQLNDGYVQHNSNSLWQRFPNWAPQDLAKGAAKTCESCCIYCFLTKLQYESC